MWEIILGCKHQHGAHADSAATMADHNINHVSNNLKLTLKIFYQLNIYMIMLKM